MAQLFWKMFCMINLFLTLVSKILCFHRCSPWVSCQRFRLESWALFWEKHKPFNLRYAWVSLHTFMVELQFSSYLQDYLQWCMAVSLLSLYVSFLPSWMWLNYCILDSPSGQYWVSMLNHQCIGCSYGPTLLPHFFWLLRVISVIVIKWKSDILWFWYYYVVLFKSNTPKVTA